ncbi:MAG: hypothetical protein IJR36_01010 [Lachnospiraceae bacterium]|nr:hypothetical protein [Lachnospiraceae bacterium]
MTINIILTFDNYAEFVRSLTPEAIDELMKDKEPVIPSAYEWLNAARIEGGKLPEPTVPAPTVPEPDYPEPQAMAVPMSAAEPGITTRMTVEELAEKVELAEVRKLLAEISRKKGKEASKALIQAAGAERLTEVAPEKLADLYAAAKEVAADA